jgi:pimeloyl-ACP methyl ester carboxylesterase
MPIFENGDVKIHYEEKGSGFPLLVIPGGGLEATIAGLDKHAFNPLNEFSDTYRVIALDLRTANTGQSDGPIDPKRSWDIFTDDQLALMDHLGIDKFLVMGFCIGGPMIWNLLKHAGDRVVAAVLVHPSGYTSSHHTRSYDNNMKSWGPTFVERRPDFNMDIVSDFLNDMYTSRADFVYTVDRDFVRCSPLTRRSESIVGSNTTARSPSRFGMCADSWRTTHQPNRTRIPHAPPRPHRAPGRSSDRGLDIEVPAHSIMSRTRVWARF